ncbi:MAG: DUF4097 family beta strand repeat-containing protein [Paenibacillaceae bacterium]
MKTWKIGSGTLSFGLIGIGILLLLHYSGVISNQLFQYAGPIYIILFGVEVIWSNIRNRGERQGFSSWSIIVLVVVFIISSTHMVFPSNFNWQPSFLSVVEGNVPLESGITLVEIRIPNGKVEVIGTNEEEISYSGQLSANAASQEKADQVTKSIWKVQKNGDTLELVLEQKGAKWNLFSIFDWTYKSPYLTVHIPQSLLTKIETSNGSVHISDMNSNSDIKTSNGAITVVNLEGNIKADTSNGSGTFTNIKGSLDMHTNNGALTLTDITGAVIAESSNGSIKGSSIINGEWECVTSNGRITLAIPKESNADIEAKTSNGSVGGELEWQTGEKTHRFLTIGAGTYNVLLKTSNGSIHVDYNN